MIVLNCLEFFFASFSYITAVFLLLYIFWILFILMRV